MTITQRFAAVSGKIFGYTESKLKRRLGLSTLRGADLRRENLRYADLHDADLLGANLRGMDLRGTEFIRASLFATDLRGGADLSRAENLTMEQLAEALIDETTILPASITLKDIKEYQNIMSQPLTSPAPG